MGNQKRQLFVPGPPNFTKNASFPSAFRVNLCYNMCTETYQINADTFHKFNAVDAIYRIVETDRCLSLTPFSLARSGAADKLEVPWPHTCHILPPSEIDSGLCLAVFAGSGGEYLFHRIGRKGRIWQL